NAYIDTRMMSTVIRNLLINAIKFTPRRGSIVVIVQEMEHDLEISVMDTGIGMSMEAAQKIFENKTQTSSLGTESEKGVGLGLIICKSFVEQNGGTITVSSKEGYGTKFCLTVPKGTQPAIRKQKNKEIDTTIIQHTNDIDITVFKDQTVLIIDDNETIISVLKSIFEPYCTVFTANDGQTGLEFARNILPHLIITDISMPLMNGIDLCKAIKDDEITNHIPIIIITAETDVRYMQESYKSGADDFIEKPFDKNILLYKAKSLLENRKKLAAQTQIKPQGKGFILPDSYDDSIINRALEYINENFCDSEFDVNSVADKVGLSRTQLWRKFKSKTNINLSDYIQELRMEKAKEMLLTGKYKVAEVAYDVGFTNPQYFTKCFTQYFGEPPREYAEKLKSKILVEI
ncbi:MAG: ATP-binding protein, partial [Bacteroidales bacterium]